MCRHHLYHKCSLCRHHLYHKCSLCRRHLYHKCSLCRHHLYHTVKTSSSVWHHGLLSGPTATVLVQSCLNARVAKAFNFIPYMCSIIIPDCMQTAIAIYNALTMMLGTIILKTGLEWPLWPEVTVWTVHCGSVQLYQMLNSVQMWEKGWGECNHHQDTFSLLLLLLFSELHGEKKIVCNH